MTPRVEVVDPDSRWPAAFDRAAAELAPLLAPWQPGGIHHIGSTSVPGLAAKPIIDMLTGVADLDTARAVAEPLERAGWRLVPLRPDSMSFDRPGFHLHLAEPGGVLWRERLALRDALHGGLGATAD